MSYTTQQEVIENALSPADVSESIFGDFTEDIDTAESGDIEIDDITPPTMVNYVITC